ncbi:hypothetical protein SAMN06266787_1151, partial [Halorubrum ezzemoulense]
ASRYRSSPSTAPSTPCSVVAVASKTRTSGSGWVHVSRIHSSCVSIVGGSMGFGYCGSAGALIATSVTLSRPQIRQLSPVHSSSRRVQVLPSLSGSRIRRRGGVRGGSHWRTHDPLSGNVPSSVRRWCSNSAASICDRTRRSVARGSADGVAAGSSALSTASNRRWKRASMSRSVARARACVSVMRSPWGLVCSRLSGADGCTRRVVQLRLSRLRSWIGRRSRLHRLHRGSRDAVGSARYRLTCVRHCRPYWDQLRFRWPRFRPQVRQ